jgi:hypothetical protein
MADDQVVCVKWCADELGDDEVEGGGGSVLGGGEGLGYSIYCGRLVEYI